MAPIVICVYKAACIYVVYGRFFVCFYLISKVLSIAMQIADISMYLIIHNAMAFFQERLGLAADHQGGKAPQNRSTWHHAAQHLASLQHMFQ